uniref:Uncharacterized protein n=1 Tax=Rhizophora mucronata TaxID=61149 RepID=A0A2P2N3G8_RHIMU
MKTKPLNKSRPSFDHGRKVPRVFDDINCQTENEWRGMEEQLSFWTSASASRIV